MSDSSDAKGTSLTEHGFDLCEQLGTIIRQGLWWSNRLGCGRIDGQQDLPNVLLHDIFLGKVDNMLANKFVLKLLWLVLDCHFLAADLQLAAKLIAVADRIVEKELPCGAVLDPHLGVCLHGLSNQG